MEINWNSTCIQTGLLWNIGSVFTNGWYLTLFILNFFFWRIWTNEVPLQWLILDRLIIISHRSSSMFALQHQMFCALFMLIIQHKNKTEKKWIVLILNLDVRIHRIIIPLVGICNITVYHHARYIWYYVYCSVCFTDPSKPPPIHPGLEGPPLLLASESVIGGDRYSEVAGDKVVGQSAHKLFLCLFVMFRVGSCLISLFN